MKHTVEPIAEKHIPIVIGLMRDFAEYEKLSSFLEVTEARLRAAMFDPGAFVEGFIAFDGDEPAGYAIFYPCFCTFRGQRGIFLEDLYVSERYRGAGIGETLLRRIAQVARSRGFERIDFQVLEWNKSAIGFYEKLGAVRAAEERHFKFTDSAFIGLANADEDAFDVSQNAA